jgi:hypothetical protein
LLQILFKVCAGSGLCGFHMAHVGAPKHEGAMSLAGFQWEGVMPSKDTSQLADQALLTKERSK